LKKSIRVISEIAWQAHFVKNMFISPSQKELANFKPDFTLFVASKTTNEECKTTNEEWKEQGLNSEVFVVFNIETWYALLCQCGKRWRYCFVFRFEWDW